MLERVNYNPYSYQSYLTSPKVDGLNVVIQKPVVLEGYTVASQSFEEIYEHVFHDPNNPRSRYENAMAVYLGQIHAANYINYDDAAQKLRDLRFIAESADYSGMSDAEKVMAIFDRYDQSFGDFRKGLAIGYPSSGTRTYAETIRMQFFDELRSVFGSTEKAFSAYRTAQYGNMSDTEVMEAIAAKYPPAGQITLREFYEFVCEMEQVGLGDGLSRVLSNVDLGGILVREELLDKPMDFRVICDAYNSMRNAAAKNIFNDVGSSGVVLRELFGVVFDDRGNAYADRSEVDFNLLIKQLFEKYYEKWTIQDYEAWFQSQYSAEATMP